MSCVFLRGMKGVRRIGWDLGQILSYNIDSLDSDSRTTYCTSFRFPGKSRGRDPDPRVTLTQSLPLKTVRYLR